jgi:hypothetical protein
MSTTTAAGPTARTLRLPESGRGMLVDLQPDEFLFPGSKVAIHTREPLDKPMSLRAIGTSRADGAVRFSSDATRATWTPAKSLRPGRHVLQIGPLLSSEGKEITGEDSNHRHRRKHGSSSPELEGGQATPAVCSDSRQVH